MRASIAMRIFGALPIVAVLLVGSAALAVEPAELRIGVAPFEAVAPPGSELPDLATLVADRIATRGVGHVVGPAQLGAEASAEPDDASVKAWAGKSQLATVVVGRATRLGSQISVTVRLRSGETGAVVATYVSEILRQDQVEEVVDSLATRLIDGTAELVSPGLAPVSSRGTASAKPSPKAAASASKPLGISTSFDSSQPMSINSDQLEAFQTDGRRRLVFTRNVVVVQGNLTIKADRLEAQYPAEASQPSKLIADGRVHLVQGKQEARCDHAVYDRAKEMLLCSGNAHLRDGGDEVRGREIEFDLAKETVVVKGGASVLIAPKKEKAPAEPTAARAEPTAARDVAKGEVSGE